ncbi:MAG: retron St85 family RNA-directed DNA polymerase [Cephaloticoccus sp.]|nr:retron St85 family RNA-directed DNA polymerase [Cephaloticoccus sp.]
MRSNRTVLRLFDLPPFSSLNEFCALAHFNTARVRVIATESKRFYKRYNIPKRSGGEREILQPTAEVKAIQAWILRNILDKLKASNSATAFTRGVSLMLNVQPHASNRYYLCMDIENFFPSVSSFQVQQVFSAIGYSPNVSYWMTKICTVGGRLPQGGVTSPSLSNLVCLKLDRRLSGYAASKGLVFTRYADDMTFSSNNPKLLRNSVATVRRIVQAEGFIINTKKTHLAGPNLRCVVTGLVKNASMPAFGIGRKRYRMVRAEIHNFVMRGGAKRYNSKESISGMISFIEGINRAQGESLRKYWYGLEQCSRAQVIIDPETDRPTQ